MPICVPIKDMKNTAEFTETVIAASEPVFVTKNGREALVSMSPEVYEGLCREAARARLYDIVDCGMSDMRTNNVREAKSVTESLRASYGA